MMRDWEFLIMGVFVLGIMLCMFIDVLMKNKAMRFSYPNQKEIESTAKPVKVIEVFEGLADFGILNDQLLDQKKEFVYPMYIDCSRNSLEAQPPAC